MRQNDAVDAVTGEREGPGVTRYEVGLEPHEEFVRGAAGDARGVLARTVPFSEVRRGMWGHSLAHGAPHPVGCNDVARGNRDAVGMNHDVVVEHVEIAEPMSGADIDAVRAGDPDERSIELEPWSDRRVEAIVGQRHTDFEARRRPDHGAFDDLPVGHVGGGEPDVFELS